MPGSLHRDALPLPRAGVARAGRAPRSPGSRRRSTSRRCTSRAAGRRGEGRRRRSRRARLGDGSAWRDSNRRWDDPAVTRNRHADARSGARASAPRIRSSASSSRTSRGAGSAASRRRRRRTARLEALCHVGANVVPSGRGCAVFAEAAARSGARMVIGEEQAVGELWEAARARMPRPRDDRPGPAGLRAARGARAGGDRAFARRARSTSTCSCRRARRRTARRSASIRSSATPRASAGGRASRSRRAARGSGSRTA